MATTATVGGQNFQQHESPIQWFMAWSPVMTFDNRITGEDVTPCPTTVSGETPTKPAAITGENVDIL